MAKNKVSNIENEAEDIDVSEVENEDIKEKEVKVKPVLKTEEKSVSVDQCKIKCIQTLPKIFFNKSYLTFKKDKVYNVSKALRDILIERKAAISL